MVAVVINDVTHTGSILRPRHRSKKFLLVGPDYKAFHGYEIISKLTKGPKTELKLSVVLQDFL